MSGNELYLPCRVVQRTIKLNSHYGTYMYVTYINCVEFYGQCSAIHIFVISFNNVWLFIAVYNLILRLIYPLSIWRFGECNLIYRLYGNSSTIQILILMRFYGTAVTCKKNKRGEEG